ncbi:MAG: cyclase family protein [Rhodoluna sp.]
MKIAKIVDLSHPVDQHTQVYPGDPVVDLAVHSTIERDGFNLLTIKMGSQSGTHVDAPFHFDDATEKIDELPLERFMGRGIVVNLLGIAPRAEITWEMIKDQLVDAGEGDIVLLQTGFSAHWQTEQYFNNPFLSADACKEILAKGVLVIGIDAMNIDETPDETHPGVGFPSHHLIAEVAGVICENITNLDAIDFDNPMISLLPMKFTAADGAPVRAVAIQFAP